MIYSLYGFLLCLFPVHSHYAQNISEISLSEYVKTLIGILLVVLAGVLGLNLLVKNIHLSCLIFSFVFYVILYAHYFYIALFSEYKRSKKLYKYLFLAIYIIGSLLLSTGIYFVFKQVNLLAFSKLLFYFSFFITLFVLGDIFSKYSNSKVNVDLDDNNFDKLTTKESDYPDIYHILLDSHPGFSHENYVDYEFKSELEKRGFYIYEDFQSNYNTTSVSLPSMLNMDYVQNFITPKNDGYTPDLTYPYYANNAVFSKLKKLGYKFNTPKNDGYTPDLTYPYYANNAVFSKLKKLGYKFNLFIDPYFYAMLSRHTDSTIDSGRSNYLNKLLLFSSIGGIFVNKSQNLEDTGISNSKTPAFSYMHILAPHWPYLCNENGVEFSKRAHYNNANYFTYAKFVDKQILGLIDEILERKKDNSLIVLHSDHSLFDTHILMAVNFPKSEDSNCLKKTGSLVNLYRCIFNKYFGFNYEMLENKAYKIDIYFRLKEVDFK